MTDVRFYLDIRLICPGRERETGEGGADRWPQKHPKVKRAIYLGQAEEITLSKRTDDHFYRV